MKLSELSTDKALDVLCELTPHVSEIVSDEGLVSALGKVMDTGNDLNMYGKFALLAGRVSEIMPLLLKSHRGSIYGILSVLNEKTAAEIAAQPVRETMRQIREAFQDVDLLNFFKSSAQQEQNGPSAPSAGSPASV